MEFLAQWRIQAHDIFLGGNGCGGQHPREIKNSSVFAMQFPAF